MPTYNIRRGPFVLEIGSLSMLPTEDRIQVGPIQCLVSFEEGNARDRGESSEIRPFLSTDGFRHHVTYISGSHYLTVSTVTGYNPRLRARIKPFSPKLHFPGYFNTATRNRTRIFQPEKEKMETLYRTRNKAPHVTAGRLA